jgi:calcineurin-like phosphoesterase family protein
MSTFLFADPHFFHESIIRMCARPFANAAEMNDVMASSWRAVVKRSDDIIVVGDFAHRADPDALKRLFVSLPGRKHLVVGNHDGPETLALPWESVHDILVTSIDSTRVVLCHYAMRTWPGIRKHPPALQLFGHSHGRMPGNAQSMDIGVDVMGWSPVRLNQIKAVMAELPPLIDPESGDDIENDEIGGLKP